VVVADSQGGVRAYGADHLKLLWERTLPQPPQLAPQAIPGGVLLLASPGTTLTALGADTGQPVWESVLPGP